MSWKQSFQVGTALWEVMIDRLWSRTYALLKGQMGTLKGHLGLREGMT